MTVNVLTAQEQAALEQALNELLAEVQADPRAILRSDAEDIHSWVEGKLIGKVGDLGKNSTPDAAVTTGGDGFKTVVQRGGQSDPRGITGITAGAGADGGAESGCGDAGYTHLQRAQPVTLPTGARRTVKCWRGMKAVSAMPGAF